MQQHTKRRELIVEILSLWEYDQAKLTKQDPHGLTQTNRTKEGVKPSNTIYGRGFDGINSDDENTVLKQLNTDGYTKTQYKPFKIETDKIIPTLNRLYQNRKIQVKVNGTMVFGRELPNTLKVGSLIEIKLR